MRERERRSTIKRMTRRDLIHIINIRNVRSTINLIQRRERREGERDNM